PPPPATGSVCGGSHPGPAAGTVSHDTNADGTRNTGEPALGGWTVYDDRNNNGTLDEGEPYAVTSETGAYTLTNLGPGTHYLRVVVPTRWDQTAPGSTTAGAYVIALTSGQSVTDLDFGSRLLSPASVSGQVFHDLDGSGTRDPGELGLQGWRVFDDANNNGVLDAGEQFVDTDADGNYTLAGLQAGTHTIRLVPQDGWTQTAPADGYYT